ncbi:MAG: CoA-binding protein [Thermodesulfobacteriota bacterium]
MAGSGSERQADLALFFEPRNVAVIGSFKKGAFGGYVVIKSLSKAGYSGEVYPVNPAYQEVLGLKVYPSVGEIPAKVDLALIMINARHVPAVIRECAQSGIRAIVLVADGFAERDREGARLQEEVVRIAREWGVSIIGPNTAGLVNNHNGFNPSPYDAGYYRFKKGSVAICSQTGMINPQAYPYPDLRFGISKLCDFGNKCDLDECDLLEYLEKDPATKVISMYLETIRDGRRFLEVCERVAAKKPLLALKVGATREGARASASHTGALAVDDKIFEAACRQSGVLRLNAFNELFELPKVFAAQPLPKGNRFGLVSYTGAIGVLAADEGAKYGLAMAKLAPETAGMFEDLFPGLGGMPVDIGPMIPSVKDFSTVYLGILQAVLQDENVDSLFNVLWADAGGNNTKAYLGAYEELKGSLRKPVVTWIYGPDSAKVRDLTDRIEELGFPVFGEPERCVKALGLLFKYADRHPGNGFPEGKNYQNPV